MGGDEVTKHDEYMDRAKWAEYVPFDQMFGTIVKQQAVIPMVHYTKDDEPHPATHGMEGEDE